MTIVIRRDKEILNFKETDRERRAIFSGTYPHIVEDKIYFQLDNPKQVGYAVWDDEKYIKPKNNIILSNDCAANNWKVFFDTNPNTPENERYKAVGGYHVGTGYPQLSGCSISNKLETIKFPNPVWPDKPKSLFKDNFYHPRHANGLYVFVSPDGITWKEYHDKPIFSVFTECNTSQPGVLGLDYMPSIFYHEEVKKYVIYIRANIALGCRSFFCSFSQNLIDWSKPELINSDPPFDISGKQNFYFPSVYPFGSDYIAFPPNFVNKIHDRAGHNRTYHDEHTPVMLSKDGLNFKTIGKILEVNTGKHLYQPHVCSFREENNEYILYVHEGFQTANSKLVKYKIEF